MTHLIVDDEQAKTILESSSTLEIRDRNGKHLGYVTHGFSGEDIALARQRMASNEPRYTTEQVLRHLESLEQK